MEDFGVHGKAEMISYEVKTTDGLEVTFHFGIVLETPLVVWKVEVLNDRQQRGRIGEDRPVEGQGERWGKVCIIPEAITPHELGFYSNGWQIVVAQRLVRR